MFRTLARGLTARLINSSHRKVDFMGEVFCSRFILQGARRFWHIHRLPGYRWATRIEENLVPLATRRVESFTSIYHGLQEFRPVIKPPLVSQVSREIWHVGYSMISFTWPPHTTDVQQRLIHQLAKSVRHQTQIKAFRALAGAVCQQPRRPESR